MIHTPIQLGGELSFSEPTSYNKNPATMTLWSPSGGYMALGVTYRNPQVGAWEDLELKLSASERVAVAVELVVHRRVADAKKRCTDLALWSWINTDPQHILRKLHRKELPHLLGCEESVRAKRPLTDSVVIGEIGQSQAGNSIFRIGTMVDEGSWAQAAHVVLTPDEREQFIDILAFGGQQ